ncbi:hypothetical protein [Nocardioides marmorisolisilvae]|uniref:LamG domain-containing protein n=1 Tax=Nocardioides marmorisolisilvae TaxID=1542737 RepID=A0A3N0DUA0_9ACTN|nr:hypothetical protein [Nocardioides marmorisolisilvae]RNL79188.1 hypothetical protein EFL95_09170 [Nocardioides marmorisolisilvae]
MTPLLTPARVSVLLAGAAVLLVLTGTSASLSGWTAAAVSNGTNNAADASLAFTHSYPTGSCSLTARTSGTVSCSGSPAPAAASSGSTQTAVDSITNDGTLTAAQLVSDFRATSCAPVQLANSKTAADPMLPRYSTSFAGSDPWAGAGAIGLSGGAYAADVQATNTGTLLGSSYALGVWFKVANGYASGGPLLSLDVAADNGTSAAGTPMIYMDTAGKIRFRVTGTLGTSSSGVSAAAYNDGSWHFALLSVAATLVSTPTLYVDNAAGVSGLGLAALTGGNAYWHLGWADFTGVGSPPASTLTGSLAGAFVTAATVSSATRTSLFGTASSSAYATAVLALSGITHFWPLTDAGTSTYGGSLPVIGATSPCTMLDIGWATTSPAGTVVAAGTKVSTFADGTWHTIGAPAPAATQTSTISLSRDATWNSYIAGLRLYLPIGHRVQASPGGGNWAATLTWAGSGAVVLG